MTSIRQSTEENLVICMQIPDLATIEDASNCVFIATRPELLFGKELNHVATEVLDEYILLRDYDEIRHELVAEWEVILRKYHSKTLLADYFYYFSTCRTSTLFWSRELKRVFDKYTPKTIWLPRSILNTDPIVIGGDPSAFQQFIKWSLQKLLIDESARQGCQIRYYEEDHNPARKIAGAPKNAPVKSLEWLAARSIIALDRVRYFMAPILCAPKRSSKPILITAQISKIHRLIDLLVKHRVNFKIFSYDQLEKKLFATAGRDDAHFLFELNAFSAASISDNLEAWLCQLFSFHDCITEQVIANFLHHFKPPMITDGGHNPIIARINRFIAKSRDWKIFTVPEGGLNFFSFHKSERFLLPSHVNLVRFLSSSFDLQLCVNQGEKHSGVEISGYDTSLRYSRVYGRILRLFLRLLKARGKTIVFYDHALFYKENMGIYRTNARPERLLHAEVGSLTGLLDCSHYYLITSDRGEISKFRLSAKEPVFISRLHWSVLASCADVIITRESTILLESLKIGRPVVFYDPFPTYPAIYPYLKHLSANGYRYVSNPEGLRPAVDDLRNEVPNPALFNYYMSNPHYADLLRRMGCKNI